MVQKLGVIVHTLILVILLFVQMTSSVFTHAKFFLKYGSHLLVDNNVQITEHITYDLLQWGVIGVYFGCAAMCNPSGLKKLSFLCSGQPCSCYLSFVSYLLVST